MWHGDTRQSRSVGVCLARGRRTLARVRFALDRSGRLENLLARQSELRNLATGLVRPPAGGFGEGCSLSAGGPWRAGASGDGPAAGAERGVVAARRGLSQVMRLSLACALAGYPRRAGVPAAPSSVARRRRSRFRDREVPAVRQRGRVVAGPGRRANAPTRWRHFNRQIERGRRETHSPRPADGSPRARVRPRPRCAPAPVYDSRPRTAPGFECAVSPSRALTALRRAM